MSHQQNESFLDHKVQSFSVWNKQTLGSSLSPSSPNNDDEGEEFKITVTENMKSLVVSTVTDQSKKHIALDFLKRFYNIYSELSSLTVA